MTSRRRLCWSTAVSLVAANAAAQTAEGTHLPMFKKMTPVVVVDAIEPVLPFWEALGFKAIATVPHGKHIGFVILQHDNIEIMCQTRASVRDDLPAVLEGPTPIGATSLYFEVSDLDAIAARVPKAAVIVPRRVTSYGATELIARDPAGNVVGFAVFKSP
jgi:hypothetical protein